MCFQIPHDQCGHRMPPFERGAALMRLQDDVSHRFEVVGHGRFICKHIESSAGNAAIAQRLYERGLVHDRSASDVDQDALRPERLENGPVDDAARRSAP